MDKIYSVCKSNNKYGIHWYRENGEEMFIYWNWKGILKAINFVKFHTFVNKLCFMIFVLIMLQTFKPCEFFKIIELNLDNVFQVKLYFQKKEISLLDIVELFNYNFNKLILFIKTTVFFFHSTCQLNSNLLLNII